MYSYGSPHMAAQKQDGPARTYIQQLCEHIGCCPEDLPRAMNDREEWWERVRDIRAASTIWWNIDNKKDFSLSFETFVVILLNVVNKGNWKSSLNLTMSVMLHSTQNTYNYSWAVSYSNHFGAIAKNCWLRIFLLWSKAIEFKYRMISSSFDQVSTVWLRTDEEKKQKIPRNNNYRRRLRRWHSDTGKYTWPSRNTSA